MSIDTATIERVELPKPRDVEGFPVTFYPKSEDSGSLLWRQINAVLSSSLRESGFPQPVQTAARGWFYASRIEHPSCGCARYSCRSRRIRTTIRWY